MIIEHPSEIAGRPRRVALAAAASFAAFAALALPALPASAQIRVRLPGPPKCANIYYDRVAGENYTFGRVHALYLQNLLGHFPNVTQKVSPIEKYRAGDIETCEATFYLGTHYRAQIPKDFYKDFMKTRKRVLWAGYNVWNLGEQALNEAWGVRFKGLSTLDTERRDAAGNPGFFKFHSYKGETFTKYGKRDIDDLSRFNAAFEIPLFELRGPEAAEGVLSWATHSGKPESKTPYVLAGGGKWYFGDSPFSFTTEDDRYLIFADVIFDVLGEKPRHEGKRPALFRVEDIHAELPLWPLFNVVDAAKEARIPFGVSLIPVYSDPRNQNGLSTGGKILTTLNQKPEFLEFLRYAEQNGASWIMHGVTHQSGTYPNPLGTSGDDFEFWDIVRNKAMPQDGLDWVVDRLHLGASLMDQARMPPVAWLTPHYQASPYAYALFGQLFRWNVGRVVYFPFTRRSGFQPGRLPDEDAFDTSPSARQERRKAFFADAKADWPRDMRPNGQMFPYEIYGDVYGQRLIPENLGNLQPYYIPGVYNVRTLEEMLATMKRNRVIRDAWASFFFHPFLLESSASGGVGTKPSDLTPMRRLISTALENGYEFVSLKDWWKNAPVDMRPEPRESQ